MKMAERSILLVSIALLIVALCTSFIAFYKQEEQLQDLHRILRASHIERIETDTHHNSRHVTTTFSTQTLDYPGCGLVCRYIITPTIGPPGLNGTNGIQGPQGIQGLPGAAGPTGPMGPTGLIGPTGATGATGLNGATGSQGPVGPVGATGPSIKYNNSIARVYAANSFTATLRQNTMTELGATFILMTNSPSTFQLDSALQRRLSFNTTSSRVLGYKLELQFTCSGYPNNARSNTYIRVDYCSPICAEASRINFAVENNTPLAVSHSSFIVTTSGFKVGSIVISMLGTSTVGPSIITVQGYSFLMNEI
jgi:hypothetical protein